jgi:arylsulfatase A-like enzyme
VPGLAGGEPGEYLTDRLTDEALEFIERPRRDQPFFLNLSYYSVHTPIEAPEEDVERFRQNIRPEFNHRNPTYAAMVSRLDGNVGRILDKIDGLGLSENTVVMFSSDNGGYINEYRDKGVVTSNTPLRSGKGSLYEGGIRVPLMVRAPGVSSSNQTCETPVCTVDYYPTLLGLAGVETDTAASESRDGRDLSPLLRNTQLSVEERPLYFHYPHYYFFPKTAPVSAIRKGDWKLVEHFEENRVELFNLTDDLSESQDLSQSHTEKANELLRDLKDWQKGVNAQFPEKNPDFKQE